MCFRLLSGWVSDRNVRGLDWFGWQLPQRVIEECHEAEKIKEVIENMPDPYRSVYEWILDLCVEVVNNKVNKMDSKNMSIVLSPNLYQLESEASGAADAMPSPAAFMFTESLQKFTQACINWRVNFRTVKPVSVVTDALADTYALFFATYISFLHTVWLLFWLTI